MQPGVSWWTLGAIQGRIAGRLISQARFSPNPGSGHFVRGFSNERSMTELLVECDWYCNVSQSLQIQST
jgi:hypothetical protein